MRSRARKAANTARVGKTSTPGSRFGRGDQGGTNSNGRSTVENPRQHEEAASPDRGNHLRRFPCASREVFAQREHVAIEHEGIRFELKADVVGRDARRRRGIEERTGVAVADDEWSPLPAHRNSTLRVKRAPHALMA